MKNPLIFIAALAAVGSAHAAININAGRATNAREPVNKLSLNALL
jgi:hypothetical protein